MENKLKSIRAAAALVADGAKIALGGNLLHRAPLSFARELARQGKKNLELIKTAGAYDIDLLCAAGCAAAVHAGFVGFENEFGLAPNYRKAVEAGRVLAQEHACYTVIAALRASAYGIPFQPVAGMIGSDLLAARSFVTLDNPYGEGSVVVIPRLTPDWAVIHVQEADTWGNGRISGSIFEDVLMTRAARGVILTVEKIIPTEEFIKTPELTVIPHFLTTAVVELPGGAAPGSCYPYYDYDAAAVKKYLEASGSTEKLKAYLEETL
jgi:glutaconate CoA-transferase subunit A